jgi:Ca2+-binding EF-hand superfamily protein
MSINHISRQGNPFFRLLFFLAALLLSEGGMCHAADGPAIHLAIISEDDALNPVSDLLTAELSKDGRLALLERDQMAKVLHEQTLGLALDGKKDFLKVGQLLGADGLLLLNLVKTPVATNLMTRLIAVKPGVVLLDEGFTWPIKDIADWSSALAVHLSQFLPKLTVLVKDSIPISVVNLRSAVPSDEARETERQVKLLTIQRLSQERPLFVLERQRMDLLGEEKELKSDESPFWNGSYLLEGVLDQNGYAKETITLNARLTPPKSGAALQFEVSGARTNLAELVNQLAVKVNEALKVNSTVKEWNANDEAAQYFAEAKWALRWGVYTEAQMAAESAWALGKRDMDCAQARVKAYLGEIAVENAQPIKIEHATRALELYYNLSRSLPDGEPKILWRGRGWTDWHNSDWYQLGIDDLDGASTVLQSFYFAPELQNSVSDKLAALRALARSVAALISQSPSVHDRYFLGAQPVTQDEIEMTLRDNPSIFKCEVACGSLWQDTPEDCLALYRQLMSSPAFSYIHEVLWAHPPKWPPGQGWEGNILLPPRLVGWNEAARRRVPAVWNSFLRELLDSTNVLLQLEAKAMKFADAENENKMGQAFTALMDSFVEDRCALRTNQVVQLDFFDWGIDDLVNEKTGYGSLSDTKKAMYDRFRSEYLPKLAAKDDECADEVSERVHHEQFEEQKRFLKTNTPFNPPAFIKMFQQGFKDYSKAQALEIRPLFAAYKSNLVEQAARNAPGGKIGISLVAYAEANVNRILAPHDPAPGMGVRTQTPAQPAPAKIPRVVAALADVSDIVTNVLTVNKFLEIPLDAFPTNKENVKFTAHHWIEGKLLLDLEWIVPVYSYFPNGTGTSWETHRSYAIMDPITGDCDVIDSAFADAPSKLPSSGTRIREHAKSSNGFYNRSTMLRGDLFTCEDGQVRKYDLKTRQWVVLDMSDGNNYELFAVNGHLYAADGNTVFEIMEDGKGTHLLASTRRQPPMSVLDTQDLGTPTLFEGPDHSLRIVTKNKIFTEIGDDWRSDIETPAYSLPPVISIDGVLFVSSGFEVAPRISRLAWESHTLEFCLGQEKHWANNAHPPQRAAKTVHPPEPTWKMPPALSLLSMAAASHQSNLYLLEDHSVAQIVSDKYGTIVQRQIFDKDGYHAKLLCFAQGLPVPQKLFLKFEAPNACPPVAGVLAGSRQGFPHPPPTWMLFSSNLLFFGLETQSPPDDSIGCGYKLGVWFMTISQLETALTPQKQAQFAQLARAAAAAEQLRKDFMAKYDRNHNGVIDPEEREEALDEPAFIKANLDVIDANQNGWLDAAELAYFDANTNKILEPKEQAGIEIAQHLLAEKLFNEFDVNGDGVLDIKEFIDLVQASFGSGMQMAHPWFARADDNHDGRIDLEELEIFLKRQTSDSLRSRGRPGPEMMNPRRTIPIQPGDAQIRFKAALESYWQNPGGAIHRPRFQRRPFGPGSDPNNVPKNETP